MIYLLIPMDTKESVRIFSDYGLMEQVMWSRPSDWCTVYGYELAIDEYQLIWMWHKGPSNHLIRSRAKS